MTRKTVTDAVKQAALKLEYCFFSDADHRMNQTIIAYPAVWMSPPKVVGVAGCNEGKIRYRVVLQIMQLAKKASGEQKEEKWARMELHALQIYREVAQNRAIASVTIAECAPAEFSLTNHGEISMSLALEIEVPFCNL